MGYQFANDGRTKANQMAALAHLALTLDLIG
jgi:hypothetical protein